MPTRTVRIVGDPDAWSVIGETPTSMILVNPAARRRRDVALLREQLAALEADLAQAEATTAPVDAIDGP